MLIEATPGETIYNVTRRAIDQCNREGMEHSLKHNGIVVRVHPGSHEFDIAEKWDMQRQLQYGQQSWRN